MSDASPLADAAPTPPQPAAVPKKELVGVEGWLGFLCVVLIILQPIFQIGSAAVDWHEASPVFSRLPALETLGIIEDIVTVIVLAFGVYAGICLWRVKENAVFIAKSYYVTQLVVSFVAPFILPTMTGLPERVNSAIAVEGMKGAFRNLIVFAIWFTYLSTSRRVKNTYGTRKATATLHTNALAPPPAPVNRVARPVPLGFVEQRGPLQPQDRVFDPFEGQGTVLGEGRDPYFVRIHFDEDGGEREMKAFGLYVRE